MSPTWRLWLFLPSLAVLCLGPGCAQQTSVLSDPEGAKVVFEGQEAGRTPQATLNTQWGLPRTYLISIEKPGYKPVKQVLHSNYHADLSLLWLLALIAPYFWTARLENSYTYKLEPDVPEGLDPRPDEPAPPATNK